jgi:hypothetical protein
MCRPRHVEVLKASKVLKNVLAVVGPYVDAVCKLGPRGLVVIGDRGGRRSKPVCCHVVDRLYNGVE